MPTYKLTYLSFTGLGESIRFLLHYGGISFEDNRLTRAQWAELKQKMPMEHVPVLEVDGKVFHQSRAIGRYLAKQVNLYGFNDLEAMEIDAIVDDIDDWRMNLFNFFYEEDAAFKEKLVKQGQENSPFYLKRFEERVKKNGGYFVGNKLSWADVVFTTITEIVNTFLNIDIVVKAYPALKVDNVIKDYPALRKICETVRTEPKIKAYLEKRPANVFTS